MKHLTSIEALSRDAILDLLDYADEIKRKNREGLDYKPLLGKTVITSFPPTSLRTRVSFETGIFQLGAQALNLPINFDGKEPIEDIIGYLNCWIDGLILRHPNQDLVEKAAGLSEFSVVNAMTRKYHPCEILGDLQTIREIRGDLSSLNFVFLGEGANISNTWFTAAGRLNLNMTQVCPPGYEIEKEIVDFAVTHSNGEIKVTNDIEEGLRNADIILTDGWPPNEVEKFKPYQINLDKLKLANRDCIVNPCPPFTRGNEIAPEIIDSPYFIGYRGKENLLHMQKAILVKVIK